MTDPLPRRIAWFAPWTWKRRWWIVGALVIGIVAYPLSYGPVYALCATGWIPWPIYTHAYTPIFWLEGQHHLTDAFFNWYQDIFYDALCC